MTTFKIFDSVERVGSHDEVDTGGATPRNRNKAYTVGNTRHIIVASDSFDIDNPEASTDVPEEMLSLLQAFSPKWPDNWKSPEFQNDCPKCDAPGCWNRGTHHRVI